MLMMEMLVRPIVTTTSYNKVVLTFIYSGDDRTITLHEIDGDSGIVFVFRVPPFTMTRKYEHEPILRNVFVFPERIPPE